MIAFDLDGVFVSEFAHDSDLELERVLAVRTENILPIFRIRFPYYIITGRPKIDEEGTLRWINTVFEREERPNRVFHDNPDFSRPIDYKVSVLRAHREITTFVESSVEQAEQVSKLVPECRVLHFEALVAPIFNELKE